MLRALKNKSFILVLLNLICIQYSCNKDDEIIQDEPPLPPGEIFNVPGDFPTIKMAAESAGINDTIFIDPGIYYEHDIQLKAGTHFIGLTSKADSVVVDADSLGRCIQVNGNQYKTIIRGITFQNGNISPNGNGGGLYCETNVPLSIENCNFFNNYAVKGGGLYYYSGKLILLGCEFDSNEAVYGSSGNGGNLLIYGGEASITNCTFRNGYGKSGGAVYGIGEINFTNCNFLNNSASDQGNGVYVTGSKSQFEDCIFEDNHQGYAIISGGGGGGLYATSASTLVTNCRFINNSCYYRGGGIWAKNTITIQQTVFAFNSVSSDDHGGGAVYWKTESNNKTGNIQNCTFYGNSSASMEGNGIYGTDGILNVFNSIVSHGDEGTGVYVSEGINFTIKCSDIWGNAGGDWVGRISDFEVINGNFSTDPLYSTDYFNIDPASPCASGNNECNTLIGAMPIE